MDGIWMRSACPHDCPSTCALEVEVEGDTIGRVRGDKANTYTDGVICAKVARYRERVAHPDRVLHPMVRTGPKGSGQFSQVSWDEALDRVAEAFLAAEAQHGAEAVWPYYYAGTMGLVQRDGIHRLRHAKKYSRQFDTICTNMAWTGFIAGTGRLAGPDPREMRVADCVVIWGTNAVSTQVNVMTHAVHARKTRGAKVVVVDVYETDTAKQADLALILKPGTDAALACAVMHVAFRNGYADRAFLARFSDDPEGLEAHLWGRSPEWAAGVTGLPVAAIEEFAALVGRTKRTFFRLGYGFTRQRNGAVAMHAASSIATVLGSWQHEGGGAFHNNGAIYELDKSLVEAAELKDLSVRALDQSRIGAVLTGDPEALKGGPPVTAMLIQNTNPMVVAPEQDRVREGFFRDDLFVVVHEQVMTETAMMADVVLPATMFVEHDDVYKGGGHSHLLFGPKLVEAPGEARDNHFVHCALGARVGASHPGFEMSARDHVRVMVERSGLDWMALEREGSLDMQPDFATAHYVEGFSYPDGKFRFRPDWGAVAAPNDGPMGPIEQIPTFPDQWDVIEGATEAEPLRLVTAPARSFLNSSFNETPGSQKREGRPTVMVHPDDAAAAGVADGALAALQSARGRVRLHVAVSTRVPRGTVVAEGLFRNADFVDGVGINVLTGADPVAPYGGAAFHDNRVKLTPAEAG
ncbi:MAG: molybdopterin-dependent oxidoreductase [Pseudomonadota bacterium]